MKLRLLLLMWLAAGPVLAQEARLKPIRLRQVSSVSVDRLGNFYAITHTGNVHKYSPEGKLLASRQLTEHKPPTLLEPWNPLRVFAYQQKDQHVTVFDYNLEELSMRALDPVWAVEPVLACPTPDNNLWILDGGDFSLKKISLKDNAIVLDAPLDTADFSPLPEVVQMREYQNMIFILEKKSGISVYNNVGQKILFMPAQGISFFNFMGEELYFFRQGEIVFVDLYTQEKRALKAPPRATAAVVTDERIFYVLPKSVEIMRYSPPQD
jgi:hypothetical protein